jgi:adenylate kinase
MDKKPYAEAVARFAREHGESLAVYHVGDRMYEEAQDVRPGRILDLPLSRLHSVRRSVLKDIITDSADQKNVIVNTHATFRWRHGLFRAFDFDQIEKFRPDLLICMVDNVEAIHRRLHSEHKIDASYKDLMVWREEEILATELLALAVGCEARCYVLPRGRGSMTTRLCYRLVCRPEARKVYLSFPMSHVADMPDVLKEIDEFKATLAGRFIAFDPGDVDEKLLLDSAIAAAREAQDFVQGSLTHDDGRTETFNISAKEILSIAADVDGQIYARDFQLIDQSDMIISLVPQLAGGVPGLSSGVERELQHAYEHGKEVYVIWKPVKNPSPFITETATKVFRSTEDALKHFEAAGMFPALNLFGE